MSVTIDLIPQEFRAGRVRRKRGLQWAAINCAALAVVALIAFSMHLRTQQLEKRVAPLRNSVAAMSGVEEKLGPLAGSLRLAKEKQAVVNRLLREPFWSGFFGDLGEATGSHLWLNYLRITKEAEEDAETEAGAINAFALSGVAASDIEVIDFFTRLNRSDQVKSLHLDVSTKSENTETKGMIQFEMTGELQ